MKNSYVARISTVFLVLGLAGRYRSGWTEVAGAGSYTNPYRVGWENFLRHIATDAQLVSDLSAGIRDVQLAEACYRSVAEKKWIAIGDVAD